MSPRLLAAVLISIAACGPAATARSEASSSPPVALPSPSREPGLATPPPTAGIGGPAGLGISAPTPEPPPLPTRAIAGVDFALMSGAADLRIEATLSRDEDEVVAATIAADIPAVEGEFERSFVARPVIYVFGSVESYAEGFVRIFGYSRTTATLVAENSVSFFEPSLRLIAVNWEAIRSRRPVAAIRHELTHLLTLDACSPRCDLVPAWLNEGQARLAEALVPGGEWRMLRVRYEAASMAATGTVLPLVAPSRSSSGTRSPIGPGTSSTRNRRGPWSFSARTSAGAPLSRASTSVSDEARTSRRRTPRSPI